MKLSVAIVAFNESAHLGRTLESVAWADEIVVLDSGSTDDTVEIARRHGAQVYFEPWRGYGPGVNSAIDKCTSPWVLSLDADEVLTPELQLEIQGLLAGQPEFQAYTVPRLNRIFGRWMKHGGLYPDRKLRLFEAGTARLPEDTEPHATPKWKGPTGKLKQDLLHYQYASIKIYLSTWTAIAQQAFRSCTKRQDQQLRWGFHCECGAESNRDLCLQLYFQTGFSRRTGGAHLSSLPLHLCEPEVRQGLDRGQGYQPFCRSSTRSRARRAKTG